MKGFVNQLTNGFLSQLISVVVVGVMLFTINWQLALYTLLPAPLVIGAAIFFWKRVYPRYYRVWDANSKLHSALNTILSGIRVVKAFGQEQREQARFGRSSTYIRDSFRGVEYTVSMFNPSIGLLFQLGGLIVWYAGGQMVLASTHLTAGDAHHFSLGQLIKFLGYLGMFYAPLTNLTQLTNWLTQFLTATQRTLEILDTPAQVAESQKPQRLEQATGAIVFENVTFGYNRHEPILKNISFTIAPGEHIGIVGKSGSGKTTIINLLARFYDVDEGRVLIDGIDVREMVVEDLRKSVGVVLQEPFLFRGTIYNNITYGRRDASPEQVLWAAKSANAHDFIIKHPLGYDTYIGERGAGLSGGERQRVSIGRALLYDPRILVLDEATSSVDTESEQLIQEALSRVTKGRTTIAIAHRLSTLKNSDRIFVIDHGRLVESGTHEELLAQQGLYYRLVKIQTELSREPSVDSLAARK
jgi:ATP-binding cassette subfamily B protein